MKLISNGNGTGHKGALEAVFADADQITLSVAFMKEGGAAFVEPLVKARLNKGATVEAFIGTDFFVTEPKALKRLLDLQNASDRFTVFVGRQERSTFHPKAYVGRRPDGVRCLVGSANLTGGALGGNDELSISVELMPKDPLAQDLEAAFTAFRDGNRFQRLDALVLEQYSSRFAIADRKKREAEKAIQDEIDEAFDLRKLDDHWTRFQRDPDAVQDLRQRRIDRLEALRRQKAICELDTKGRLSSASAEAFRSHLRDLMSSAEGRPHLWHSDAIYRQGSKALDRPKEMIDLFILGKAASSMSVESGYAAMREAAKAIPGVGMNMITEILCTYAPQRFAVFNGNTSGALRTLGFSTPASVQSVSVAKYVEICRTIDALRERIGGADFTDADAFLNWVYFKEVRAR
jgi:HKD family nuclease